MTKITKRGNGYKADLDYDLQACEKQDGDLERMMWIARRRALITELRVINAALGLDEIVIPGGMLTKP